MKKIALIILFLSCTKKEQNTNNSVYFSFEQIQSKSSKKAVLQIIQELGLKDLITQTTEKNFNESKIEIKDLSFEQWINLSQKTSPLYYFLYLQGPSESLMKASKMLNYKIDGKPIHNLSLGAYKSEDTIEVVDNSAFIQIKDRLYKSQEEKSICQYIDSLLWTSQTQQTKNISTKFVSCHLNTKAPLKGEETWLLTHLHLALKLGSDPLFLSYKAKDIKKRLFSLID